MIRHKYTKEQDEFLINNVKGITLKELVTRFNREFNLNLSMSAISNRKVKLKISSGIVGGQFKKGHNTWNKGKTWNEYMSKEGQLKSRKTNFKKGNVPHNHRLVGSERITVDGYIEVKVAEPNKWDLKSRVVYREHYGKIPDGYTIIYLDGNSNNLEISNLKAISRSEELIMNKNKLRYSKRDLTESGYLIAKIIQKRGKLKNERL